MSYATILEVLGEMNPEALMADGLEKACIGFTVNNHHAHVAVYDLDACIDVLVARDGMTSAEAEEFLSFNTLDAFVGENGPIFIRMFNDEET